MRLDSLKNKEHEHTHIHTKQEHEPCSINVRVLSQCNALLEVSLKQRQPTTTSTKKPVLSPELNLAVFNFKTQAAETGIWCSKSNWTVFKREPTSDIILFNSKFLINIRNYPMYFRKIKNGMQDIKMKGHIPLTNGNQHFPNILPGNLTKLSFCFPELHCKQY